MKYMLMMLILLCSNTVCGQEFRIVDNSLFQEVVVRHNGSDYCFHRTSSDARFKPFRWNDWEQWQPYKQNESSRKFKPLKVDPEKVINIIGQKRLKWLEDRANNVGVSGYYNFTGDSSYDWKNFAGDTYILQWQLPILKDQ